jgi:hypothetical protein
MKKLVIPILALFILAIGCGVAFAGKGNGIEEKRLFTLNVIAYEEGNCPNGDFTDSNRHMIAVQASYQFIEGDMESTQAGNYYNTFVSTNTIKLVEGDDFQVTDGNACNKGGAAFMLPANPFTCPEADPECLDTDPTFQEYEVYVRLVGKPGTGIGVTGCAVDQGVDLIEGTADDIIICSTENSSRLSCINGRCSARFTTSRNASNRS